MPTVHIVTDSSAQFTNPHFVHQYPISVLPNRISIAGRTYREGVDISSEDALKLIANESYAPLVTPPSSAEYLDLYTRLARQSDAIISIHVSRELYPSWQNAKAAAHQLMGHPIAVIDSRSISAGQAMLIQVAAKAIEQGGTVDDIVRMVRGAVDRIYTVYYVESIEYLLQNKIMSPSHTILGTYLGIKPFLALEEGRLTTIEKVRTRIQAIDRLVEFVIEFAEIDDVVILQHKPYLSEQTRLLQDRLALEFPGRHFPYTIYGPSLAALIGTEATGLTVLESETDAIEDDFSDEY